MEKKDWEKIIKLTKFKSLSLDCRTNAEFKFKLELKKYLLENGYTYEMLEQEVANYSKLDIESIVILESEELFEEIKALIEKNNMISTKDYIDIYYKIEEIISMDRFAADILTKVENKYNIYHETFHSKEEVGYNFRLKK